MSDVHGYPDWVRVEHYTGPLLEYTTAAAIAADTTLGPFFVGNWPAVRLVASLLGVATACEITATFYADSACTQPVGSTFYQSNSELEVIDVLAVTGPWMKVLFHRGNYLAGPTRVCTVQPIRTLDRRVRMFQSNVIGARVAGVVAGGATDTRKCVYVMPGSCTFAMVGSAVGLVGRVYAVDSAGTRRLVASVNEGGVATGGTVTFWTPPHILEVDMVNTTGGAITGSWTVTAEL